MAQETSYSKKKFVSNILKASHLFFRIAPTHQMSFFFVTKANTYLSK